jgi:hypothetical protein
LQNFAVIDAFKAFYNNNNILIKLDLLNVFRQPMNTTIIATLELSKRGLLDETCSTEAVFKCQEIIFFGSTKEIK